MNGRLRVLLAVVLVAAFVGGGSSVAWALWTATGTTASSVTNGKVVAGITGTEAITTTFTSADPTATRPVTLRNTGNIAGTTATRVLVAAGSVALAQAVDVVAWPVPSADGCTATGDVGSGAVRGTWAALPSLVSHLGPRADAVWCIRSTVRADAPPQATTDVHLELTTANGSWVSATVSGGLYLNTGNGLPAFTCTDHDGNYVDVAWARGTRPDATYYAAYVGEKRVGASDQGYHGTLQIAPVDLPPGTPAGPVTVDVRVLDDAGQPTDDIAGSGPVTLFTQQDGPAIRCGA
ncbi:hypothetical protein DEJ16_10025 [Curtobacterium sp. MCJR17_055]|uniref:hypothetical protein n=1 Tax=unclassified Curtobacterium TaxID=257496 RepID=UPI000D9407B5|nr:MULTISPECIES: hypothetical protein [unclassified Curtobacterium]PYY36226.1 hypothetical protein DEI87_06840 [Curtobacterium sp. MCBD17_029]PYY54674.1 hypothetical protein DEJ16_10025 [Curtobacterium sp. MCJR17_055]PYY60909.1 hypothetical protein DEJ26_03175 [Curtobacterium sp. MCPF17_015]